MRTPQHPDFALDSEEDFLTLPLEVKQHDNMDGSLKAFLSPTHYEQYTFEQLGKLEEDRYMRVSVCPDCSSEEIRV
jgi:hypothetical protein